jgi:hypothetical protein
LGKQGNGILDFRGNRTKRILEIRAWEKGWKEKGNLLKENCGAKRIADSGREVLNGYDSVKT